jgi:hypothetical protein
VLISSFNGKPQALPISASACGLPLNENTESVIQAADRMSLFPCSGSGRPAVAGILMEAGD